MDGRVPQKGDLGNMADTCIKRKSGRRLARLCIMRLREHEYSIQILHYSESSIDSIVLMLV
jgi:hypothetical protein